MEPQPQLANSDRAVENSLDTKVYSFLEHLSPCFVALGTTATTFCLKELDLLKIGFISDNMVLRSKDELISNIVPLLGSWMVELSFEGFVVSALSLVVTYRLVKRANVSLRTQWGVFMGGHLLGCVIKNRLTKHMSHLYSFGPAYGALALACYSSSFPSEDRQMGKVDIRRYWQPFLQFCINALIRAEYSATLGKLGVSYAMKKDYWDIYGQAGGALVGILAYLSQ